MQNKRQRAKVRELILQTKDESKIRSQIEEIEALEMRGGADKRHKAKKKTLLETLVKIQEHQRDKEEKEQR
jgi:hypothetical protein